MGFSDFFRKVNPFLSNFKLKDSAVRKSLEEDHENYLKIKDNLKGFKIRKPKITVYYPGCGSDLANVLLMIDALEEAKQIDIVFVDPKGAFPVIISEMNELTEKPKISVKNNKAAVHFKDKKINMIYYQEDAFKTFPKELENGIDLYFERAFNLFRHDKKDHMDNILSKINPRGFIVSDYGFDLKKDDSFKKVEGVPKDFGFYKKLEIYQKVLNSNR